MNLSPPDRQKLLPLLIQLCEAIEDLLSTGLTTASESTRQILSISFQETSRMGLLRLGSTVRFANDELGRFTRGDTEFSRRRYLFFLNRAWLLSHGLIRALKENNTDEFDRLSFIPKPVPIAALKVVTLGMFKKLTAGVASFEFRMRLLKKAGDLEAGQKLVWSTLFPVKPNSGLPLDAYMHMPQKQKFVAADFLGGNVIDIKDASVSVDRAGMGRLTLTEASVLSFTNKFTDWQSLLTWAPAMALDRIKAHSVSPLDLDVELQEEIVLNNWYIEPVREHDETQNFFPVHSAGATFHVIASKGEDGKELSNALTKYATNEMVSQPLYGLLHYERCKLILQPLALFADEGPTYLMMSTDKIDRQKLVKALSFK